MTTPVPRTTNRRIVVGVCLALVLMVWFVFGQALSFGFINYDDDGYVYENLLVRGGITWAGVTRVFTHADYSFYHPLTTLSHMLDYQIYGLNPAGFHATNLLLHTTSVLLLFLILRSMTGSLWRSAFVAAIFAIHPLRVESVVWVTERKDTLSGVFFMLTLAAYIHYVRRSFSWIRYGQILFCMAAAMLSKALLVTVPFLLLLLDYWPLQRFDTTWATWRRLLTEKIPFLILSASMCYVTVLTSEESLATQEIVPVMLRLANAMVSYGTYIFQSVFPAKLAIFYPYPLGGIPLWKSGAALFVIGFVTFRVFREFRRKPYLLTGWFWYLGMLAPVIGIMQAGAQAHADRYTYFSQIGLVIMATWLAADWCASLRYRRAVLSTAAIVSLAALAIAAHGQARYWHDSFSLWTRTLACTDGNYLAHNNLGNVFGWQGQFDKAISHFEKSIEINPHFSKARYNLGLAFDASGKPDEAISHYEKALEINPKYAEAHSNLGTVFAEQGQVDRAIFHFEKALQINPYLIQAHYNLASVLNRNGQFDKAIPHFEKSLQINPDSTEAHYNLGLAFEGVGKLDAALEHYEKALADNKRATRIHDKMGRILLRQGRSGKALPHFEEVFRTNPDSVEVQNNLAWILATCPDTALRNGKRAVELAHSADRRSGGIQPSILDTLAAAQAEAGRYPEAVTTARRALDLAAGQESVAEGIRMRLRLYEAGVPYHEPKGEP